MILVLSFAALLPRLLLGFGIVHVIWNAADGRSMWIKIFLSAGVGSGVSSLLGFLWVWIGLPLAYYVVLESVVTAVLVIGLFYKKEISFRFEKFAEKSDLLWTKLLGISVFLFAINNILYGLQYPHGRPDAWINWNVVARFIYLGGADWQATFLRQWDHPDYPLFIAVTNAITWVFLRKASIWGPVAFHFVISFFTAGLLFSLVNFFRGFRQASLTTILFISLPFIIDQGMRQYADFLLAYLILAAGGMTLLYIQTREPRLAILTGLLIGLGGWVKNEGLLSIFGVSVIWAWIALKKDERFAFQNYILGLIFPLLITILFKILLAPSNDLFSARENFLSKVLDYERYTTIFTEAGVMLLNLGNTPVSLIGIIIMLMLLVGRSAKRLQGAWIFGVLIGFQLTAYFFVFIFTPNELTWHLRTSLDRLYLHVLPLALFGFFIWLKSPQELLSKES